MAKTDQQLIEEAVVYAAILLSGNEELLKNSTPTNEEGMAELFQGSILLNAAFIAEKMGTTPTPNEVPLTTNIGMYL